MLFTQILKGRRVKMVMGKEMREEENNKQKQNNVERCKNYWHDGADVRL